LVKINVNFVIAPIHLDEYDFIIVGSGAGGCALANRLSENIDWNVLLVEAGKVETFIQNVPLLAKGAQMSEPQFDACRGS
jgi:choline dehydrogenase-like flavoprotein